MGGHGSVLAGAGEEPDLGGDAHRQRSVSNSGTVLHDSLSSCAYGDERRNRRLEPAYKQHAAVDDLSGVIVDVEVATGEENEGGAVAG